MGRKRLSEIWWVFVCVFVRAGRGGGGGGGRESKVLHEFSFSCMNSDA